MGKVTGGLLSLGASGSVANTLTFSKWKGRPYVRQRVVPANPQTTAQQTTRNVFSNMSAIWKAAPALFIAPWDAFAVGQVLTGRNAMIGQNVAALRGDINLAQMIFSPGSKGGLAPTSTGVTPTVGGVDITITPPATPTGWTLQAAITAVREDGNPETLTLFGMAALEDLTSPYLNSFTGLSPTTAHVAGSWLRWLKPDGTIAYGASLTDSFNTL